MAKSTVRAESVRIRVAALSTSNLTLSGAQTVDSVACVAGDLVGALGQSNGKNGVYVVQSGAWLAVDPGFGTGLEVYALAGGSNANKVYGCDTTGAIDWGTTSTTFTLKESSGGASSVTSLTADKVVLTGQASAPSVTANSFTLFGSSTGDRLGSRTASGDLLYSGYTSNAGTGQIVRRVFTKSLADDATLDISLTGGASGGFGRMIAFTGVSTVVSGMFSFAADATTSLNGATYTSVAVTNSDTNLCAFASGGNLRIANRLGATYRVMVEILEMALV